MLTTKNCTAVLERLSQLKRHGKRHLDALANVQVGPGYKICREIVEKDSSISLLETEHSRCMESPKGTLPEGGRPTIVG